MKISTKADLSLALVSALWGVSFVVVKDSLSLATPYWFLFLRFLVASGALLVFLPGSWRALAPSAIRSGFVVGFFVFSGFIFQTLGLQYTTPAKSAFITGSSIVMVPLLNALLFRARLTRTVAVGICIAFAGLYLLTNPADLSRLNRGDGLTLICALAFAFHIIYVGRYAVRTSYRQLAVLQIWWAWVFTAPLALVMESPRLDYPPRFFLALIFLGVFCSALAFLIQTHAQQYTSPSRAALIFSLEPVFAAIASVLAYGEEMTRLEWFGGTLVVLGVLLGEINVVKSKKEPITQASV